jgi:dTDP-4-dehydrorhamnose reductase
MNAASRLAIVGAGGQLAFELARTFEGPGELVRLAHSDLDLLDHSRIRDVLTSIRPTHVLNGAAYNLVDRAEDEPHRAFALNADAVGALAETCQALGATFVHFSTDYVFDGRARRPYREEDAPNPLSAYAESKLAGERLALGRCERAFVVRVCGLFGAARRPSGRGGNFVETMLRLAREGRTIRVVSDQVVGPSSALEVARKMWQVLRVGSPGLYHVSNAGQTSWHGFAREIFRQNGLAPDLRPVTTAEYGARAKRPAYSVLAHARLAALGEDDLSPWPDALAAYLRTRGDAAGSATWQS